MIKHPTQKGFTLIETLVAIAILIVAITGAFSAAQSGLSGAAFSRDQVTAFYLAQEGIEEIRNIRDENNLSGRSWLTGVAAQPGDPCYFGSSCTVDAITNSVTPCPGGTCPVVRNDPVNGFYGYDSSWNATPFVRTVTLSQVGTTGHDVQIVSTVTWTKGLTSRTFRIREDIMN